MRRLQSLAILGNTAGFCTSVSNKTFLLTLMQCRMLSRKELLKMWFLEESCVSECVKRTYS